MPPCFGMGAFFWRARLRFALASCGALGSVRDRSGGEPAGVSATSQGGPFRTGSDPAGHMKRKTMSAHFATAPYTVPVNVNGV